MKTLYLDCAAGISGDMTVGALIDLGVPLEVIRDGLSRLGLPAGSYAIAAAKTAKLGITATSFRVDVADQVHHRHYAEIKEIIDSSGLEEPVRNLANLIFLRLADAEATVHGVPINRVHFHEVGALDSIVDIVGASIALHYLGVEEFSSSPLPYGSGWVETAHGRLPVPAPATVELMRGLQVKPDAIPGEWVTPTGAAIVAALCRGTARMPEMGVTAVGYGAGTRECSDRPNLLRAVLGETKKPDETVFVMETHLDDINPEILGFLMDRLFDAGALDVAFSPLQMKKSRPGFRVTVMTDGSRLHEISRLVLTESTAIGVRYYPVERVTLERKEEQIRTTLGPVRIKKVWLPDGSCRINPEFEECRRISLETGIPIGDVYRLVERESR